MTYKNHKNILPKKLLPDNALLVIIREALFIGVKYQQVAESVAEKLQTCDFKKKQYLKLIKSLNLRVEYSYVLNDWFKHLKNFIIQHHTKYSYVLNDWFKHLSYSDVLKCVHKINCHYKFNDLPRAWLGLPK